MARGGKVGHAGHHQVTKTMGKSKKHGGSKTKSGMGGKGTIGGHTKGSAGHGASVGGKRRMGRG